MAFPLRLIALAQQQHFKSFQTLVSTVRPNQKFFITCNTRRPDPSSYGLEHIPLELSWRGAPKALMMLNYKCKENKLKLQSGMEISEVKCIHAMIFYVSTIMFLRAR